MSLAAVETVPNYGEVFTRRWVGDVLLDLTGYTPDRDLATLHLLEPSCGSGAFLGPAIERLIASATATGGTSRRSATASARTICSMSTSKLLVRFATIWWCVPVARRKLRSD